MALYTLLDADSLRWRAPGCGRLRGCYAMAQLAGRLAHAAGVWCRGRPGSSPGWERGRASVSLLIPCLVNWVNARLQVLIYKSSLGAVYEAGNFMMSTWIPLIWAGVNVLVLILSSFPTQGGL